MEKVEELLDKYLNEKLAQLIISNPRTGAEAVKISLRPVLLKGILIFQAGIQQEKRCFIEICHYRKQQKIFCAG